MLPQLGWSLEELKRTIMLGPHNSDSGVGGICSDHKDLKMPCWFESAAAVESSCARFRLEFSHLPSRRSLLPSLPPKDTEGRRQDTECSVVAGKAAESEGLLCLSCSCDQENIGN